MVVCSGTHRLPATTELSDQSLAKGGREVRGLRADVAAVSIVTVTRLWSGNRSGSSSKSAPSITVAASFVTMIVPQVVLSHPEKYARRRIGPGKESLSISRVNPSRLF
jgi:hypothetical protein